MTPDEIMTKMAETFLGRNSIYGDNYKNVGKVMNALFPEGMQLSSSADFELFHLFELIIVKLTRFANGNLQHRDSIHDAGVYSSMIESILSEREERETKDRINRQIMQCATSYLEDGPIQHQNIKGE